MVLQDNVSWAVGYTIPLVLMLFTFAGFVAGSKVYRFRRMGVSPLTSLCQVVVASVRKWHLDLPDDSSLLYELTGTNDRIMHTDQFSYLC
jgi:solute carrier family 15 (peptide/histidine transporter), member 3/4